MRVLVCGGRDYRNEERVFQILGELYFGADHETQNEFMIITGEARGADALAKKFAKTTLPEWSYLGFPADWDKHGKAAGHIRNQQMLDEGKPDLVVAFPGGVGTADMVRRAEKAGVEIIEINP